MASDQEIDAFLAHHGVKGMHWGVHRERETEAHKAYRKQTTKQFRKATQPATIRRVEKQYGKEITSEEYKSLSTKDVKYGSGKTLNRITKSAEDDKTKSMLFVSTNKADATAYRSVLPYQDNVIRQLFRSGNNKYDGFQETTFKSTKALLGPSEKARVDAFISLLDTPAVKLSNDKTVTGREYLKRVGMAPDIKRLDSQKAGLKYYNDFLSNQYMKTPLNDAYFDSLKAKGYNVVSDDNDRKVLTKDPLIILDPAGTVKQMSVRQLTTDDILNAQKSYKDLASLV